MPTLLSGPAGRAPPLPRAWLDRAWRWCAERSQPAALRPLPAVRRKLADEEAALIDALRRRTGPALRGAMARCAPQPRKK